VERVTRRVREAARIKWSFQTGSFGIFFLREFESIPMKSWKFQRKMGFGGALTPVDW